MGTATDAVELDSTRGRWTVAVCASGSGVTMVMATVVSIALPDIGRDLGVELAGLQWVVNAYLVTLAAFILIGGSLGDRFGRRRVYVWGLAVFGLASAACALAPALPPLLAARAVQGLAAAVVTPGSLAILQADLRPGDRGRAIGAWSALTGVAAAVGPLAGGWLVDVAGWRAIFWMVTPLALGLAAVGSALLPEGAGSRRSAGGAGAGVLAAIALGGIAFALVGSNGSGALTRFGAAGIGLAALAGFAVTERRASTPMLPRRLLASGTFRVANALTLVVYAALGGVFFLLVIHLQTVLGYSALDAGAATLPITLLLLVLSARAGDRARRNGARGLLTLGPLLLGAGMLLLGTVGAGDRYVTSVLPALVVFGLGLAATVAPVTATALAASGEGDAGVASAVNIAVARVAQLLAVAFLPLAGGLSGAAYRQPDAFADGFTQAMWAAAGLAALGASLGWWGLAGSGCRSADSEVDRFPANRVGDA